jgi:hypothetical protein
MQSQFPAYKEQYNKTLAKVQGFSDPSAVQSHAAFFGNALAFTRKQWYIKTKKTGCRIALYWIRDLRMSLRSISFFSLYLTLGLVTLNHSADLPARSLAAIQPDEMRSHLSFLASDSLRGRNTPSAGLDTAAVYIARFFRENGLSPVNGSYFQEIALNRIFLGDTNSCRITGSDGAGRDYRIKKEFMPFEMTADKSCSGEIVFAGYGISTPELGYDDYAGIDVKGKIVLVLKRGPRQNDPASPFFLHKDVSFTRTNEKIETAIEHGAAGILLVTDPLHNRMLTPRGFPWPNLYKGFPPDAVPVTLGKTEGLKIPAIQVGEEAIIQLFGSVDALKAEQAAIDSGMTPHSRPLAGSRAEIRTSTRQQIQHSRNVVGLIPGSDRRLKEEVVIVGGHYDHVGYAQKTPAGQDSIFNGADDNASGAVGVLTVAKALAAAEKKPRRSILCIAFTGEEKGLYGSTHYTAEPLIPLEKTAAMLNMDMISRNHLDSLSVTGIRSSQELRKAVLKANKKTGFQLDFSSDKYLRGGSDHAPFVRKEIPVLFFFSGMHADYHKVSDEVEKCNVYKMARVAELCSRVAWQIANDKQKPVFVAPAMPVK